MTDLWKLFKFMTIKLSATFAALNSLIYFSSSFLKYMHTYINDRNRYKLIVVSSNVKSEENSWTLIRSFTKESEKLVPFIEICLLFHSRVSLERTYL